MSVFRIERNKNYTVMSNYHLRDTTISLKSKGLLSMMLSLPDEWNYTTRGLAKICKEGVDAIGGALRELEKAGYIVRRVVRNERGRICDMEYTIYEQPHPRQPCPPQPDTNALDTENSDMVTQGPETTAQINKDRTRKDQSNTDSIPFRADEPPEEKRTESNLVGQMEQYRALIRDNIQYPLLVAQDPDDADLIDEIVELMTETVCAHRKTTRVCGSDFPAEVVKSRLLKLDAEHIRFVLKCLHENTAKVKNIKQYLLATLYNAPVTINSYYSALVSHDLAEPAGKETAKGVVPMLAE